MHTIATAQFFWQIKRSATPRTASSEITQNTDVPVSVRVHAFHTLAKVNREALFSVKLVDFQTGFRWQLRIIDWSVRSKEKQQRTLTVNAK